MADDPLFGDRDKPPLVPMSNEEVVEFDGVRALMRMSPNRRRFVLGGVLTAVLLLLLIVIYAAPSSRSSRATNISNREHQALASDCSQLRADEKAYANGTLTQEFFNSDLLAMTYNVVNPIPPRFRNDLETIGRTLVNSDSPAGPALNDAHRLCTS